MARVELSQSKIKTRRRRRRVRAVIVLVVALLAVCGALVAFFRAPFLRVTSVAVTGAQTLSTDEVAAFVQGKLAGDYLFVLPKDDIFLYPQSSLGADLLAKYPTLKHVDVHADNFHTVGVVLSERQPAALWCATNCYYMDEDGTVYSSANATSSDALVTYSGTAGAGLPKQFLTPDKFQALAALVAALSQTEAGDPVRQVAVDDNGDVRAYFQNSFLLMFNIADEGGDIFQRFTLARKADPLAGKTLGDIEYIDLRFGDKLYYKLKTK